MLAGKCRAYGAYLSRSGQGEYWEGVRGDLR